MNPTRLLEFFETHRERGEPLVLVTVFDTEGSTYSKAGAQMLVNKDGVFRGMLSGGCLEGDLAVRARQVLDSRVAQTVSYDLGSDDDELWGMGVGCDGLMRMVLSPLWPEENYAPFDGIAIIWRGDEAAEIAIAFPDDEDGELTVVVEPPPRVLIMGAGLDAEPVVRFAAELGWRCTVTDHRSAYIESGNFDAAEEARCAPVNELAGLLEQQHFDAAVVMSHHLASDLGYLRQLAATEIPYVGLLGPSRRRDRLLTDLGASAASLRDRLHGPAGLDIGGRGPAPIALSIIAEIQKDLVQR